MLEKNNAWPMRNNIATLTSASIAVEPLTRSKSLRATRIAPTNLHPTHLNPNTGGNTITTNAAQVEYTGR
jgi:hypothetical protein